MVSRETWACEGIQGSWEKGASKVYEVYPGLRGSKVLQDCQVLLEKRGPGDLRVGLEMKDPKGYRAHLALQVSKVLMGQLENLDLEEAKGL